MTATERQARRRQNIAAQKPARQPSLRQQRGYDTQQGTDLAYTLVRLHEQRPDLYEQVIAKKLSAHFAAVLAGFRVPYLQVPDNPQRAAETLMRFWGRAGVEELIKALQEELEISPVT